MQCNVGILCRAFGAHTGFPFYPGLTAEAMNCRAFGAESGCRPILMTFSNFGVQVYLNASVVRSFGFWLGGGVSGADSALLPVSSREVDLDTTFRKQVIFRACETGKQRISFDIRQK
jgi:hypothetical protein